MFQVSLSFINYCSYLLVQNTATEYAQHAFNYECHAWWYHNLMLRCL